MQNIGIPAWIKDFKGELDVGAGVGTLSHAEFRTQEELKNGIELSTREWRERGVFLTGQCAGAISDIKPAKEIVEEMVQQAAEQLRSASGFLASKL